MTYQYNGHAVALDEEIAELEDRLKGVVFGRQQMENRLVRLRTELEREAQRERALARQVSVTAQVVDKRTAELAHIKTLHSMCARIRAHYQDPPGAGAERMRIILREIDAHRNQKRNSKVRAA